MERNLTIFRHLLRFGLPAYPVFLALLIFYGASHPWPAAQQVLAQYRGQTPLMIGFAYSNKFVGPLFADGPVRSTRHESRSYVLLPSALSHPKVVSVDQLNDQPPTASESTLAFFALLAWIVACFFGTWWFWFRPADSDAA